MFGSDHQRAKGAVQYHDKQKGRHERFAIDFAYTLNHAIVCTLTDPITDVPIGATVQNLMAGIRKDGDKVSAGEVLHGLKPSHILEELKETMTLKKEEGERFSPAVSWLAGEVAGDFGAVPVVVALQHYAPGVVKGIGKLASPVAKPFFKHSATRSAQAEFKLAGMDTATPEFDERVKELYQRELDDLPKAIMWTGVSPAINILMQKTVMGNKAPTLDLMLGKAMGATVTSSLTVGLRNTSPRHAQKWDNFLSDKTGKPVARMISRVMNVDEDKLKTGMEEQRKQHGHGHGHGHGTHLAPSHGSWRARIEQEQPTAEKSR